MSTVRFIPAKIEHVSGLAAVLREADRNECEALGQTPRRVLRNAVQTSIEAWTAVEDEWPIAMWGLSPVGSMLSGVGCAWLLTGQAVDLHRKLFLRETKAWIEDRALQTFPRLVNMVDARHVAALRWLRWLGFVVNDPVPYGRLGMPFCLVEKT